MSILIRGYKGKMGQVALKALRPYYQLQYISSEQKLDDINLSDIELIIDFTNPSAIDELIEYSIQHRVNCLIGTTGFSNNKIEEISTRINHIPMSIAIIPNFAFGMMYTQNTVLRMARNFVGTQCEIIEYHNVNKKDKPSGTAKQLKQELEKIGLIVDVHSIRLQGCVAHQEIIFSNSKDEIITIRHDIFGRDAFIKGIYLATLKILKLKNGQLIHGLNNLLHI